MSAGPRFQEGLLASENDFESGEVPVPNIFFVFIWLEKEFFWKKKGTEAWVTALYELLDKARLTSVYEQFLY